jgi:hypothetical protein
MSYPSEWHVTNVGQGNKSQEKLCPLQTRWASQMMHTGVVDCGMSRQRILCYSFTASGLELIVYAVDMYHKNNTLSGKGSGVRPTCACRHPAVGTWYAVGFNSKHVRLSL